MQSPAWISTQYRLAGPGVPRRTSPRSACAIQDKFGAEIFRQLCLYLPSLFSALSILRRRLLADPCAVWKRLFHARPNGNFSDLAIGTKCDDDTPVSISQDFHMWNGAFHIVTKDQRAVVCIMLSVIVVKRSMPEMVSPAFPVPEGA